MNSFCTLAYYSGTKHFIGCCSNTIISFSSIISILLQLGAELGALAISHLEEVTDEGIAAMATSKTAAVLLPTTAYILR